MEGKVLTPFGFKALGDIRVGDQVCNPDGTVARVLQVHDLGMKQFYRVTGVDGASTEVSGDHLWGYHISGVRRRRKKALSPVPDTLTPEENWNWRYQTRYSIGTTEQLKEITDKALLQKDDGDRARYAIIPITAPTNFTMPAGRTLMLPPYTLGVLLGDGSLMNSTPGWSKPDVEIADYIADEVGPLGFKVNHLMHDRFSIVGGAKPYLTSLSLFGVPHDKKFIPRQYLHGTVDARWKLAQGLFDTDGHAGDDGRHVEYSTTSLRLARDVQWLVRSLGFNCYMMTREEPTYTQTDGTKGIGKTAYRLSVSGAEKSKLFRLERKRIRLEDYKYNGGDTSPGKRIVSVEPTVVDFARCITVDNPNGLYITDDFMVTHNSALLLILAATQHRRSIIFRRVYPNLKGMIEKSKELLRGIGRYNSNDKMWRGIPGDRTLEFGAMEYEDDKEKYRGQEHDGKFFDELTEYTQTQFEFTSGWCRSSIAGQRCKIVATFNPPTSRKGAWIIEKLSPWLDRNYRGEPASPGELRWFYRDPRTNDDVEVTSGDPIEFTGEDGTVELIKPRSRTFIPASLDDNPYLKDSGYRAMLQSLPEPLRSQLLYGKFDLTDDDHLYQIIPSEWVRAAQKRWVERPYARPTTLGVDVSRGGSDETIIAGKWEHWIAPLIVYPGSSVPDGRYVADLVMVARTNPTCNVVIDVVGVGSSPYDFLRDRGIPTFGFSGGMSAVDPDGNLLTDRTGVIGFRNLRTYAWWSMREWLDPSNYKEHDPLPELPPDEDLFADLTSVRWHKTNSVPERYQDAGIRFVIGAEDKEDVKKRLDGRSPDRGDAVVMSRIEWTDQADAMGWISKI
jgi:hypothetical protein